VSLLLLRALAVAHVSSGALVYVVAHVPSVSTCFPVVAHVVLIIHVSAVAHVSPVCPPPSC
jgi:hypothetical protein